MTNNSVALQNNSVTHNGYLTQTLSQHTYSILRIRVTVYVFSVLKVSLTACNIIKCAILQIIMELLTQYELSCILIGSPHVYYQFIVCAFTKYGAVQRAPRNLNVLAPNVKIYA